MTLWLVTWLWQGLALALGVSAGFRLVPQVNASTRHVIWWCTFAALVWLGCSIPVASVAPFAVASGGAENQSPVSSAVFEITSLPRWLLLSIATVWALGSFVGSMALASGVRGLCRLKRLCSPAPSGVEDQLPLWREVNSGGRRAKLMMCDSLANAAVLGLRQPYIVFPSRLLDLVSFAELDQILVHEYGHVQRRDDWTRLLQAALGALLWMHPAARWIGRELSLEREVACDDWVVSTTGAARAYAKCLARIAQSRHESTVPMLLPALFGRTPDVVTRVDRLLNSRRHAGRKLSWSAFAVGACTIVAGAMYLGTIPLIAENNVRQLTRIADVPTSDTAQMPELGASAGQHAIVAAEKTLTRARSAPRERVETARSRTFQSADAGPARIPVTPRAPVEVLTVVDSTRFDAIYPPEDSRVLLPAPGIPSAQDTRNRWQITGVSIGAATRKASATVAASVTKASVSFAKSF